VLRAKGLWKTYDHTDGPVHALRDVSLTIPEGAFATISGPSGAGKTTLLLALGGLVRPTSGEVAFRDLPLHSMTDSELAAFRRAHVGFVMQGFSLVPYLTAVENVMLPLGLKGLPRDEQRARALVALEDVGLHERTRHLPRELSAGQQQRVAIARAIVTDPAVVLADEPTGNLDPALARDILGLLARLHADRGVTIVMATHSPEAAALGGVRIRMAPGGVLESAEKAGDASTLESPRLHR
jgi:putative ABC transport system ATP-binding protein